MFRGSKLTECPIPGYEPQTRSEYAHTHSWVSSLQPPQRGNSNPKSLGPRAQRLSAAEPGNRKVCPKLLKNSDGGRR